MTPLHGIACFYDVGFGARAVSRKTPYTSFKLKSLKSFPSLAKKSTSCSWWVFGTKIANLRPRFVALADLEGTLEEMPTNWETRATNWRQTYNARCSFLPVLSSCLWWCETPKGWVLSKRVSHPNVFLPRAVWSAGALACWYKNSSDLVDRPTCGASPDFPRAGFGAKGFTHSST